MAFTAVSKSTDHFNTVTYTGNGSNGKAITGVGFQPSFVWIKDLTNSYDHVVFDQTRGVSKRLYTNNGQAESTDNDNLVSFDSDGFTVDDNGITNANGNSFVSFNWKGNGQGSSNTDGSTNTTYTSANVTAGISIIKYPGTGSSATIGHGLGVKPSAIWFKQTDGTESWRVWLRQQPNYSSKALAFNLNNTEFSQTNYVGTITNSTIGLGSDGSINLNNKNYVAYAFAEKHGFSRFGSYQGTGAANSGPFIYCGFSPAWVLVKKATGSADSWFINDNKRGVVPGHNPNYYYTRPNESSAQGTSSSLAIDFKGTGFKIKNTDTAYNNDGSTYIYMAFAAEPLVGSNDICSKGK